MNIYKNYTHTHFKSNKYFIWYCNIVDRALSSDRKKLHKTDTNYVYYEGHHILPKSLYPEYKTEKWNIVLLNSREHFICHLLLCKVFQNKKHTNKMKYALTAMRIIYRDGQKRYINSYLFEKYKNDITPHNKGKKMKYVPKPKGFQKGTKNTFYGKKHTDEAKKAMSDFRIGKEPWNKGLKGAQRSSRLGVVLEKSPCHHCNMLVSKTNMIRWHGDKCKMKYQPTIAN
jgi:hypothetical protein